MAETLTSSGAVFIKAGANMSDQFFSGARMVGGQSGAVVITELINQAEDLVNVLTRKDWVAAYSGLGANVKKILDEVTSAIAAQYVISYDMTNYNSRAEAEIMLDVLNNSITRGLSVLRDIKQQEFIG